MGESGSGKSTLLASSSHTVYPQSVKLNASTSCKTDASPNKASFVKLANIEGPFQDLVQRQMTKTRHGCRKMTAPANSVQCETRLANGAPGSPRTTLATKAFGWLHSRRRAAVRQLATTQRSKRRCAMDGSTAELNRSTTNAPCSGSRRVEEVPTGRNRTKTASSG